MPIANEKANSRRQVGGTPLDIVPAAPQVWGQDEQRIKERIQNRRDATGFWLKTKRQTLAGRPTTNPNTKVYVGKMWIKIILSKPE